MLKKTLVVGLLAGCMSMPFLAQAGAQNLSLLNCTNKPSTVITNKGACSTSLPDGKGVTPANPYYPSCDNTAAWIVPGGDVDTACKFGSSGGVCTADVYMTNNCSGGIVATIKLHLDSGQIDVVQINDPNYHITSPSNWNVKITDNGNLSSSAK